MSGIEETVESNSNDPQTTREGSYLTGILNSRAPFTFPCFGNSSPFPLYLPTCSTDRPGFQQENGRFGTRMVNFDLMELYFLWLDYAFFDVQM